MILKINRAHHYKFVWPLYSHVEHFASSLLMNTYFIFQLLHILNLLTLVVLTSLHSPCTLFVDYANKSDDCANTLNDWANNFVDSNDTLDILSLDFHIPNPSLLQLLLTDLLIIYRSKINIMLTCEVTSRPSTPGSTR